MTRLIDPLLRALLTPGYALLRRGKRGRPGVHAIALTPERRIILVKLRYARGWRLPGGGRHEQEEPCEAALRELREEIGMTSHGKVRRARVASDPLLIVERVRYRPRRWSWEVEAVMEAPLDAIPPDISPLTARWLAAARPML